MGELIGPLRTLLKGKSDFTWTSGHRNTFDRIKQAMSFVHVMPSPVPKQWLRLYITVTDQAISGLMTQEIEGQERPICYLSRLNFPCTNNEAEYEALILALRMTEELGVRKLRIKGDSNLVIKILKGQFGAKEESLAMYREEALRLLTMFEEVEALHIPRVDNKHADVLATIGSREKRNEGEQVVIFKKRGNPSLALKPFKREIKDWRKSTLEKLRQCISSKVAREYRELRGTL
ncbi:Ribonuclease H domain [Sesbania bispinosa]|nr:Ribonuclease H domain [Sesbania bispinosa]